MRIDERARQSFAQPGFRGCAFIGASWESPRSGRPVEIAAARHRCWIRSLFLELAHQAGAPRPTALAKQLSLVHDGTMIAGWMDGDRTAAATARAVVTALLKAALD